TDMADYLVRQGLPFREAHAVTGHAVRYCIEHGKVLKDLNLEELRTWSSVFSDDVYEALQIEACVRGRKTYSGTAPESVARQCTDGESLLKSEEAQILAWENTDSHVYAILK
ncbi:MAG: argininosuccinate lyase, partial [Megasphaera micronuciformis]|nr:argininosuccinate lyase [Megasphaera micronuciformis]